MTPEQLAARNAATSEGQKRAWQDPDIRARRSAAIRAAKDDPLQCALRRKLSAEISAAQKRVQGKFVRDDARPPKQKRIYERGTTMDRPTLIGRIRELVDEQGMTRREAAAELGVSRGIVCGICSRKGIGVTAGAVAPRLRATPAPVKYAAAVKAPTKPQSPPAVISVGPASAEMLLVSIADLEDGQCRYPAVSDDGDEGLRYCGLPRCGRGPYCTAHATLVRDAKSKLGSGPPALLLRPARSGLTPDGHFPRARDACVIAD